MTPMDPMSARGFRPSDNEGGEIPQSSAPFSAVVSSPAMSRRDFLPQQQHHPTAYAIPQPQHGKMLIDPQTGQQYFLPTAPQPPPVAYYPVFYNPSNPPIYYPHPPPQFAQPSPPIGSSHSAFFPSPQPFAYSNASFSSGGGYRVDIPPSSSVSVMGDRADSPHNPFERHHESRLSTDSANSAHRPMDLSKIETSTAANTSMEHSARYSTTSSSTTSGFVSECPPERPSGFPNRPVVKKPQLYGPPSWWGEESSPEAEPKVDKTPTAIPPQPTETQTEPKSAEEPKIIQKPIRMDIDFSRPLSPKEPTPPKTANRVPPTAFTVDLGDPDSKPKRPPLLSSQDTRRTPRRSIGDPTSIQSSQDPKHYLFSKMIQGFGHNLPLTEETAMISMGNPKREMDAVSEAGTYVVQRMESSQRELSESTDTEEERPYPQKPAETSARRSLMNDLRDLRAKHEAQRQTTAPKARSIVDPSKNSRLAAPTRLCQKQSAPSPRPNPPAASSTSSRPSTASNSPASFRRSDGGRFSMRGGVAPPPPPQQKPQPRPPFRTGVGSGASSRRSGTAKDSPEMAAWLRRKEYDPRKAAAEAKKMQQLKTRLLNLAIGGHASRREQPRNEESENFFSNRSLSYNQPTGGGFRKLIGPIGDERSNKSQDDLSYLGEEMDSFSFSGSNADLTKTVGELVMKCQRSMQLLKLSNPNSLTESVEHLLDHMVDEHSQDGEDGMERLQRLNDAFGAIQKCLEDNSSQLSTPRETLSDVLKKRTASPPVNTEADDIL